MGLDLFKEPTLAKIVIHLGREVQKIVELAQLSPLLYFPECPPAGDGRPLPIHPQDAVSTVTQTFTARAQDANETRPLHVLTHAQHVVCVAGELVSKGVLQPADVEIVMHGKEPGGTEVTTHYFDSEGVLSKDWPFGWFDWS